jgi:hypothetical protein
LTGDIYRVTNDNQLCDACENGFSLNATDNLCWYDCDVTGLFCVEGFVDSSWLWNNWHGSSNDGSHRSECLSCTEVGGFENPFVSSPCCYGLNDEGEPNFFYSEDYVSQGEEFISSTFCSDFGSAY